MLREKVFRTMSSSYIMTPPPSYTYLYITNKQCSQNYCMEWTYNKYTNIAVDCKLYSYRPTASSNTDNKMRPCSCIHTSTSHTQTHTRTSTAILYTFVVVHLCSLFHSSLCSTAHQQPDQRTFKSTTKQYVK